MKLGIFTLTKSEQRVVILVVLALLIAAFVRYRREVSTHPTMKTSDPGSATAAPFRSPEEDLQPAPDEEAVTPSPQSSP
jgi:hypothetical protein